MKMSSTFRLLVSALTIFLLVQGCSSEGTDTDNADVLSDAQPDAGQDIPGIEPEPTEPEPTEPEPTEPEPTEPQNDPQSALDYGRVWLPSPYDHAESEFLVSGPHVVTSDDGDSHRSIQYQKIFDRERELLGYNPRYLPGRPYFDRYNLPWIYVHNQNQISFTDPASPIHVSPVTDQPTGNKLHQITYDDRVYQQRYSDGTLCVGCEDYLLRLTQDARWVYLSIDELGREFGFKAPPHDGRQRTVTREKEHIYFQDNGDVFLAADHGILHYRMASNSWAGYPRSGIGRTNLLVGDGSKPPVFIQSNWPDHDRFRVTELYDDGAGSIGFRNHEFVHGGSLTFDYGTQTVVRLGDTLHVAAMSKSESAYGRPDFNTAMVYARLHLGSSAIDTLFMGWGGNSGYAPPDDHNKPALLIDSQKYLHFFSGAHGHHIWHRHSLLPVDDPGWSNGDQPWSSGVAADDKFSPGPVHAMTESPHTTPAQMNVDYIGGQKGYTYIQPRLTRDDVIHVVMRMEDYEYRASNRSRTLRYIKGYPQGNGEYLWIDRGNLLEPNWQSYSNYRHRLHVDRNDNLYLTYTYEIQNFFDGDWFNSVTFNRELKSGDACAAETNAGDCINIVDEHHRRWPNEPLSDLGGYGYGQNFVHDPVLIGSNDSGGSWSLTTTEHFRSRQQDDNIANTYGH